MRPCNNSPNYRIIAYIIFFAAVIDVVLAATLDVEGAMYPLLAAAVTTAAVGIFFLLKSR